MGIHQEGNQFYAGQEFAPQYLLLGFWPEQLVVTQVGVGVGVGLLGLGQAQHFCRHVGTLPAQKVP